jgi:hypothetical protein
MRELRVAGDGHYLISGSGHGEHRLWLPNPPADGAELSAIIPIDRHTVRRSEATTSFLRHLKGRPSLTPQIKDPRPVMMLRALDGHLAGASYREIAEHLFERERVEREPWKISTLRAVTIRLVAGGVALMRGGYRKLLRK